MARRIGLSAYTIRMKTRYAREWATLDDGGALDGFAHLSKAFRKTKGELIKLRDLVEREEDEDEDESDENRTILITKIDVDRGGLILAGLAECGEYGAASNIYNLNLTCPRFMCQLL